MRRYLSLFRRNRAQRIFRQVKPAVSEGALHESGASGAKRAGATELAPSTAGEFVNFGDLGLGDFLGQGHMRMVGKRLLETERARVQGAVHTFQLGAAI